LWSSYQTMRLGRICNTQFTFDKRWVAVSRIVLLGAVKPAMRSERILLHVKVLQNANPGKFVLFELSARVAWPPHPSLASARATFSPRRREKSNPLRP
jgi:hypothetical protein